ncbi:glycerophosphodiester phosphodiesterase [Salinispira pacifica]
MPVVPLFPGEIRPLVFAHRGYSAHAPENTMAAFARAARAGIPGIELDIHRCASGELIVAHDSDLYRVSGRHLVIEETTLAEIREVDVAAGFRATLDRTAAGAAAAARVPLLSELFEEFGDTFYYDIEIKHVARAAGRIERELSEMIDRYALARRCLVSSFNPFSVRTFKRINPGIPTAVIYCRSPQLPFWLRRGEGRYVSGCDVLKPDSASVEERLFRRRTGVAADARRSGSLPVLAWTIDRVEEAVDLVDRGVEGIISNDPAPILAAFRQGSVRAMS